MLRRERKGLFFNRRGKNHLTNPKDQWPTKRPAKKIERDENCQEARSLYHPPGVYGGKRETAYVRGGDDTSKTKTEPLSGKSASLSPPKGQKFTAQSPETEKKEAERLLPPRLPGGKGRLIRQASSLDPPEHSDIE